MPSTKLRIRLNFLHLLAYQENLYGNLVKNKIDNTSTLSIIFKTNIFSFFSVYSVCFVHGGVSQKLIFNFTFQNHITSDFLLWNYKKYRRTQFSVSSQRIQISETTLKLLVVDPSWNKKKNINLIFLNWLCFWLTNFLVVCQKEGR